MSITSIRAKLAGAAASLTGAHEGPEYMTRCIVPGCGKEFVSDALDIPIVGQPNERVVRFITGLMNHVQTKHPAAMVQIAGAMQEYMGFLVVSMFSAEDPAIVQMKESVRATIFRFARRMQITDADIQDRIARLELDPDEEEGLNILLRDMRDLLTEQGSYAPKVPTPAQKPLVTL